MKTVSILIVQDSKYILQHRDNKDYIADPDTYGVFGGSVDEDDASIVAAALRELQEETGHKYIESELKYLGTTVLLARTPKNTGKMVDYYFYILHVASDVKIETFEGQGVVSLPKPFTQNNKVNDIAAKAISLYEAQLETNES